MLGRRRGCIQAEHRSWHGQEVAYRHRRVAHGMPQLSRVLPGGGLGLCLGGEQGCFGGGEAAYQLLVIPGLVEVWHISADRCLEACSSSADWHLGVGWSYV